MRKFLTKFCSVVLIAVVMVMMTACSLFTENLDQKYSANIKVANAANSEISVSRKELYYGYLQWGYQYAGQMNQDELLKYVTESILDDKILKEISINQFGDLYPVETALALKNTYDTIDNVLRQYVYEIAGQDDTQDQNNTTETSDRVEYQPYQKSIYVEEVNHQKVFTMNLDSYRDDNGTLDVNQYATYTPNFPGIATDKVARQALSRVVRNLKTLENGFTQLKQPKNYLNLDHVYLKNLTSSERDVLNREIERLIDANQTSILTSRLSIAYNLGFANLSGDAAKNAWQAYLNRNENFDAWVESINGITDNVMHSGRAAATNIAQSVSGYYLDTVRNAIKSYTYNNDTDVETTIMGSKLEDIYYIPHDIAQNLFTVSHILVGFTDEQKDQYAKIKAKADEDPSYNAAAELNKLYAVTQSNGKNVYEIYNEVQAALQNADDLNAKYRLFRDFIYQYNTDPGMQNPTYEYLMSTNKDKNSMIEAFTDASIDLHENHSKGAISGIVWGEYGAHIIMYTRDVADFVCTVDETLLDLEYEKSLYATLTAYGNQTMFDTLVAKFGRSYNSYRAHLLTDYKSEHEITITTSEFKDFI